MSDTPDALILLAAPHNGFCVHRQETVNEWACRRCFFENADLRDKFRDSKGMSKRLACVEQHIDMPRRFVEHDRLADRIGPMLDALTPDDWRAVVGNLFEVAMHNPGERTSKTFFAQIEVHAQGRMQELARWDAERQARNAEVEARATKEAF